MANIKTFKKGDNTNISKNFKVKEFDCSCSQCTETIIDLDHVEKLQKLREDLNSPITITSAYRCEYHNAQVGGASNSRHKVGDATDIVVSSMEPSEVADACEHFSGLGRYDTFTHIDSRGYKARWDNRTRTECLPPETSLEDIEISLEDIEKDLGL